MESDEEESVEWLPPEQQALNVQPQSTDDDDSTINGRHTNLLESPATKLNNDDLIPRESLLSSTDIDDSTISGRHTNLLESPATELNNDDLIPLESLLSSTDMPVRKSKSRNSRPKVTFADTLLAELPPPPVRPSTAPDGGYGWVILGASFSIQMIGIGLAMSFGVMYIELQEYFMINAGVCAWVGSICVGLSLGAGPLSSVLANAIGHRLSCALGGVITAAGLFVSSFAPNIYVLYLSYGVITGIGISLTYVPGVVMVGFYFDKRLPLASGLSVAGVGFGSLIYPPLIQILLDAFTWRGTMIILSGVCLHLIVFASLLRPLQSQTGPVKICDLQLLRDYNFIMFSVAEVLWNVGSLVIITVAPHYSILQGIDREKAALLLSVIGISSTIGRLIIGFLPCRYDMLTVMTVSTYLTGLPMALYPVFPYYWAHVLHCCVYGSCFGIQLAVLPLVTIELFGLEKLTSAYGYLVMADGIGAFLGPLLGAHLYDVSGYYTLSFIVAALVSFLSGALMTVIIGLKMYACSSNVPIMRRYSITSRTAAIERTEPATEIFI